MFRQRPFGPGEGSISSVLRSLGNQMNTQGIPMAQDAATSAYGAASSAASSAAGAAADALGSWSRWMSPKMPKPGPDRGHCPDPGGAGGSRRRRRRRTRKSKANKVTRTKRR